MPSVADVADAVIGVDTHADTHSLEMVTPTGVVISTTTVNNEAAGYAEALAFVAEHAPGPRVYVGVEGSRSYGVGLSRALQAAGLVVVEVEQPARKSRRGAGKSDAIDAHLAALALLAMDAGALPQPRADGDREALRILLGARREMTGTRTRQANALRALLITGDDSDRELARGAWTVRKLNALISRRARRDETTEAQVRRSETRRLARSIRVLDAELTANLTSLTKLVSSLAPGLLDMTGVGPVCGAQLVVSFSHPGRCRNEAAFAALGGVAPLPASSGKTVRHRLNRGGDRQLNRALHTIATYRMQHDPETRAYLTRRQTGNQPRTNREVCRCLKRYIARRTYRHLTAVMT